MRKILKLHLRLIFKNNFFIVNKVNKINLIKRLVWKIIRGHNIVFDKNLEELRF